MKQIKFGAYIINSILFILLSSNLYGFPAQYAVVTKIEFFETKISRVIDGDTIEIFGGEKIRFACVDTFESKNNKRAKKQSEEYNISIDEVISRGLKSKEQLSQYKNKNVTVYYQRNKKNDLYGRIIGIVMYKDKILNQGNPYMNNTKLCKKFGLD